ncbi:hypothetical protein DNX69_09830 [Rhodopseudomonas palustris]|uniref:Uncharacterized protein n=1 Tax=Rhodopseudomonas palustris TaxID=1076 RepID=A0A323UHJ5_RHOPL|nr:hypothetical protein [Rhodopseudomonas palustris]PZA12285.1 hypothetical protein DNX69_09830 [Rhodopseudomonas palustris]
MFGDEKGLTVLVLQIAMMLSYRVRGSLRWPQSARSEAAIAARCFRGYVERLQSGGRATERL